MSAAYTVTVNHRVALVEKKDGDMNALGDAGAIVFLLGGDVPVCVLGSDSEWIFYQYNKAPKVQHRNARSLRLITAVLKARFEAEKQPIPSVQTTAP